MASSLRSVSTFEMVFVWPISNSARLQMSVFDRSAIVHLAEKRERAATVACSGPPSWPEPGGPVSGLTSQPPPLPRPPSSRRRLLRGDLGALLRDLGVLRGRLLRVLAASRIFFAAFDFSA
jgi:hypothetical protein